MANDNRPEIVLDADVSPFRQKLREAGADLKRFGDDGANHFERMAGPLGALQSKFVAIGALLAGGAVFKEAVAQAAGFTEESLKLGQALGISATEASTFITALEDIDVTQEEFIGATKAMSKELRNNEADLQAMGLKTRDAAGHLRPLNQLTVEAIEILNGYKAGTDRAIAAQVLFGKSFALTSNLTKLNSETLAENAELQQRLGAIVGQENVEAWQAFDAAGDKTHLTLKAIKLAIGNALLPVLTDLGNWFVSIGPAAVTIIKGAFGGLVATFHLLTTGVTVLWETINAMVVTVAEPIRGLGEAIGRALSGDWAGAGSAVGNIGSNIAGAWGKAFDEMASKAQSTRDRIYNLFADGTPAAAGGDGKSASGLIKTDPAKKDKKAAADPSYMQYYEAALGERKRLASEENALREYSKGEELAYWQTLLQYADLSIKDRLAIEKKVSDLIVAVRRDEAKEKQALDAENAGHAEAMALLRIDAETAAAEDSLAAGRISAQARAELEIQFEQRRLEIQRAALLERLELAEQDPNTSPAERARLQHAIEKLEMQHGIKLVGLQRKVADEQGRIWTDLTGRMTGLWDKGVQAIMNGTFRWRNAFKAIGSELVGWFAQSVVGNFVKEWLLGKAKQLAISLGFLSAEKTAQVAGSAATIATKTTEATVVAGANAVEAGTGAAGAMASIPWVGPVLALAAMASVFAAVSSMGSKVKSASRGFDIPKGLNPMTQLHEEEMVLPSQYANVIRGMAGGDGAAQASAPAPVSLSVQAFDSRDVKRFLMDNKRALADALRSAVRDGKTA